MPWCLCLLLSSSLAHPGLSRCDTCIPVLSLAHDSMHLSPAHDPFDRPLGRPRLSLASRCLATYVAVNAYDPVSLASLQTVKPHPLPAPHDLLFLPRLHHPHSFIRCRSLEPLPSLHAVRSSLKIIGSQYNHQNSIQQPLDTIHSTGLTSLSMPTTLYPFCSPSFLCLVYNPPAKSAILFFSRSHP